MTEPFEIQVEGRGMPVAPGATIGAVMLAGGIRGWRTTRFGGRRRDVFCGIGVCFDCLVTVNAESGVRACMRVAEPGDTVSFE